MSVIIEQILSVLNTDTGHLAYNLVLSFSLAGALYFAIISAQRAEPGRAPATRRLILGLSLLLGLRVVLFVVSGLAWQDVIDGSVWLPMIDRAVTLLSLVLIIWLWAFPEPAPDGDAAAVILTFLVISIAIFGGVWWADQTAAAPAAEILVVPNDFNASVAALGAQIAALILLFIGLIVLFTRRPDGWGIGFIMLLVLALGHVLQFFLPQTGDYPLAVRLAQMVAFPFLALLAQRYPSGGLVDRQRLEPEARLAAQPAAAEPPRFNAAQVLLALQDLPAAADPRQVCQRIAVALTTVMDADLCLLIMPPDSDGRLLFKCGYDRLHGRHLDAAVLNGGEVLDDGALAARDVPMLASALRLGRTRRIPAASNLPDMLALSRLLKLERTGDLLIAPALTAAGDAQLAVILLNPYSGQGWTTEEASFLASLAAYLVPFLQRSQQMADMKEELEHRRKSARSAQDKAHQALNEGQRLRDQIAVLQDDLRRDREKLAGLAAAAALGAASQDDLTGLKAQNEELRQALKQLEQDAASTQEGDMAVAELRMALEEVAHLQDALHEADRQMVTLKASLSEARPTNEQVANIVAIAQDLRQPLSSIIGYTDFLLSEVIGILGAKQRKYLERIHISTERMSRLLDDLLQATSVEGNLDSMNIEEVDLVAVIRKAASQNSPYLTEKNIDLHMELPDQAMLVNADQNALRRVFSLLLRNASIVTPDGGAVNLSARLEGADTDQEYMLVQVVDSGQGIDSNDISRIFSASAGEGPVAGLGVNGAELPDVKALVEVLGGRIWVDSELGQGATFSILLPVSQSDYEVPLV